ncbi:MAG: hypothetical protein ACKOT0_01650, partial [bacterium]
MKRASLTLACVSISLGVLGAVLVVPPAAQGTPGARPRSAADGILGSWSSVSGGVNQNVLALHFVDDTLYVGGAFTAAGGGPADDSYIAAWDGSWHSLGLGMDAAVLALAHGDDTLYAGGSFTAAGGGPADDSRVAAWDGSWHSLGNGVNGEVNSLAFRDDTLYVGGAFTAADGGAADDSSIAAWDGSWHALGEGLGGGAFGTRVYAIAATDDTIYVGGNFRSAGGGPADDTGIAAWNGTWTGVGSGVAGGSQASVYALHPARDVVYAGGDFTAAGGGPRDDSYIAAWGGSWAPLGAGLDQQVDALAVDDTRGLVYAGGGFQKAGGRISEAIAVWDRGIQEWIPFRWGHRDDSAGSGGSVEAIALYDSVVYAGGTYLTAGATPSTTGIARWTWQPPEGSNSIAAAPGSAVTVTGEGFIGMLP